MSDQLKLAVILIIVIGVLLGIAFLSPGNKKNFGKVINEYQIQGKQDKVNPEDLGKSIRK